MKPLWIRVAAKGVKLPPRGSFGPRTTSTDLPRSTAIGAASSLALRASVVSALVLAVAGCSDSPTGGTGKTKSGKTSVAHKSEEPAKDKTPAGAGTTEKTGAEKTGAEKTGKTSTEKTDAEKSSDTAGTPKSVTVAAATQPTEPAKEYRPEADLPYMARRSDPVTHEIDFSVVVTPPYHSKVLKVWLPLPQSDAGQEVSDSELSTFPMEVTPQVANEPVYGNRFAYFEFAKPEGAQIIRHKFRAKVWDLNWDVDPAKVKTVEKWPEDFAAYLRPQKITKEKEFEDVLHKIVPKPATPAGDMFSVMEWIDANLKYDHSFASLRADADNAFSHMAGHCSDYHGLCATMGRRLGFPTRMTYGLGLFAKNSPSHCKVEAFLPSYGWVSFDVSETQQMVLAIGADKSLSDADKKRLTAAARGRLKRGFRENSWLLVTRGANYDLVPKASAPVPVVRTIYAEADGHALPDPDPANAKKHEFGWMTVHQYKADKKFTKPFKDYATLEPAAK